MSQFRWKTKESQREFLQNIASKFNVKQPKEWGKVTISNVRKHGGRALFAIYGSSMYNLLSSVFPEIRWNPSWFRTHEHKPGFWSSMQYQRKFLLDFQKRHKILTPQDWGSVTTVQIRKDGGTELLNKYGPIANILRNVFSEIEWNQSWFPQVKPTGFWGVKKNQRDFLESVFKKLNLKEPKDWGNVSQFHLQQVGARPLLNHFGGRLTTTLAAVFPEIKWERKWFHRVPQYLSSHWNTLGNQKEFMDTIARRYHVSKTTDWNRITLALIKKQGGEGLLKRYNYSLQSLIHSIYNRDLLENDQSIAQRAAHSFLQKALQK